MRVQPRDAPTEAPSQRRRSTPLPPLLQPPGQHAGAGRMRCACDLGSCQLHTHMALNARLGGGMSMEEGGRAVPTLLCGSARTPAAAATAAAAVARACCLPTAACAAAQAHISLSSTPPTPPDVHTHTGAHPRLCAQREPQLGVPAQGGARAVAAAGVRGAPLPACLVAALLALCCGRRCCMLERLFCAPDPRRPQHTGPKTKRSHQQTHTHTHLHPSTHQPTTPPHSAPTTPTRSSRRAAAPAPAPRPPRCCRSC